MAEGFIKSTVLGPVWIVIPEMPFSEKAGSIIVHLKNIGHRDFILIQKRPPHDGMPYANPVIMPAGHYSCPGWSTGGAGVKITESYTFRCQLVYIRGFYPGIACTSKIAVALVVGDNEDDVGAFLFFFPCIAPRERRSENNRNNEGWPGFKF